MKMKLVSTVLCGLLSVGLLCGFAAPPAEENTDLVPRQFQTAQQIDRISVADAVSNVTIQTADTDQITVDYADTTEKPLYTISAEDGLLSIQTTTKNAEDGSIVKVDGNVVSEQPNRDLVITLPQKQYQDISVELAVGTLSVQGVNAVQMTVESAVNSMELSGIRVEQLNAANAMGTLTFQDSQVGNAQIKGAAANVTVQNVTATGQMTVASAVGKVTFRDSQVGDVQIKSTTANVTVQNVTATGQMAAASAVGKVQLKQVTADEIIVQAVFGNLVLEDVKSHEFSKMMVFGLTQGQVTLP